MKQREEYYRLYNSELISRIQYNRFRNFVTNFIKTSKKNYYSTAFNQIKSNAKKTWNTINNVISQGR